MKTTININGLPVEFSDQKPTRPGAYWMQQCDTGVLFLLNVDWFGNARLSVWVGDYLAPLTELDAIWSAPLVPVTEVEKAWDECRHYGQAPDDVQQYRWANSRARRVVEGVQ